MAKIKNVRGWFSRKLSNCLAGRTLRGQSATYSPKVNSPCCSNVFELLGAFACIGLANDESTLQQRFRLATLLEHHRPGGVGRAHRPIHS